MKKQKLIELQGETNKSTIIVRDFNIPLIKIGRTSRTEQEERRLELNQLDLTVLIEHSSNRIHILLKHTKNIYQVIPYLDHKASLNNFKEIRVIKIFSMTMMELN